MKIAFLGLGNMGAHMARNLHRAGHTVTVWNRTLSKAEALRADGIAAAHSVGEAAQAAPTSSSPCCPTTTPFPKLSSDQAASPPISRKVPFTFP